MSNSEIRNNYFLSIYLILEPNVSCGRLRVSFSLSVSPFLSLFYLVFLSCSMFPPPISFIYSSFFFFEFFLYYYYYYYYFQLQIFLEYWWGIFSFCSIIQARLKKKRKRNSTVLFHLLSQPSSLRRTATRSTKTRDKASTNSDSNDCSKPKQIFYSSFGSSFPRPIQPRRSTTWVRRSCHGLRATC